MGFRFTTYWDVVNRLSDFVNATEGLGDRDRRFIKNAILDAYRTLTNERTWTYFYGRLRVNCHAPVGDGTIAYDHTGGANERQVTLTGSTWPDWAALGVLVLNNIPYDVDQLISSTVLTLTRESNPGLDLAAGTTYSLYQDTYALPTDFQSADKLIGMSNNSLPEYVHPRYWILRQRFNQQCALPWMYSFLKAPKYFGTMAVVFAPPPDQAYVYHAVYQRRPRPLVIDAYKTGTVSVTSGLTTLTGSGTAFTADMVNSVIRLGASGSKNTPTNIAGSYPALLERTVIAVNSATSLTLDAAADQTLTTAPYVISDPIDIEEGAMLTAFQRCCEWQLAVNKSGKVRDSAYAAWMEALTLAKGADKRTTAPEVAGSEPEVWRLRDFAGPGTNTTI